MSSPKVRLDKLEKNRQIIVTNSSASTQKRSFTKIATYTFHGNVTDNGNVLKINKNDCKRK